MLIKWETILNYIPMSTRPTNNEQGVILLQVKLTSKSNPEHKIFMSIECKAKLVWVIHVYIQNDFTTAHKHAEVKGKLKTAKKKAREILNQVLIFSDTQLENWE